MTSPFKEDIADSPTGIVAIVGRPNVGKSTLFNRLTGERRAIVDEMAGLTRDRLYGVVEWAGRSFTVIDTAGLDVGLVRDNPSLAELTSATQEQAHMAITDADVICFMVDVRTGIIGLDEEIAGVLRASTKPVVLVGNKADGGKDSNWSHELYRLGLGDPTLISAIQGSDTGELLDQVVSLLPLVSQTEVIDPNESTRIAIVGRPNVGKSSLLNALVGENRALVSGTPGTTRDPVDTLIKYHGRSLNLIDTAGIRRRGLVDSNVEHYSLLRSLRAIERCDVALAVIDVSDGTTAQDRHIAGYAAQAGKGLIVLANKWDLLDEETRADPTTIKQIGSAFDFVPGVPVVTTSAKLGRNTQKILESACMIADSRACRIPTPALNNILHQAFDYRPPPMRKNRQLKLLYATQASTITPTIVLFVNDPDLAHFTYKRYLENKIRLAFGFDGVRLKLVLRKRGEGAKE